MPNLLRAGAPGSGKTMLARTLPSMTVPESLKVTKIFNPCGLLLADTPILRQWPIPAPHHTASCTG